jgi:flagellar protein FlgJ
MNASLGLTTSQQFEQASIHSDLNSLDNIRKLGLKDKEGALKKAAKEFEAFFLNLMLKSMRQASEVIGDDSPMNSSQEKMYTSMLDEQFSVDLSQKGLLGIADLMTLQLGQNRDNSKGGKSLESIDDNHPLSNILQGKNKVSAQANQTPDKKYSSKEINTSPVEIIFQNNTIANKKVQDGLVEDKIIDKPIAKVASEKKSLFDNAKEFVESLLPYAEKAASLLGVNPKLLLAQAALETGWGKYIMHDQSGKPGFNLFGIKANNGWQGNKINIDTLEVEDQSFKKVKSDFRQYESFLESFTDYVDFVMQNPRYKSALDSAQDPQKYMQELQNSGYATDPNYADKVLTIFKSILQGAQHD